MKSGEKKSAGSLGFIIGGAIVLIGTIVLAFAVGSDKKNPDAPEGYRWEWVVEDKYYYYSGVRTQKLEGKTYLSRQETKSEYIFTYDEKGRRSSQFVKDLDGERFFHNDYATWSYEGDGVYLDTYMGGPIEDVDLIPTWHWADYYVIESLSDTYLNGPMFGFSDESVVATPTYDGRATMEYDDNGNWKTVSYYDTREELTKGADYTVDEQGRIVGIQKWEQKEGAERVDCRYYGFTYAQDGQMEKRSVICCSDEYETEKNEDGEKVQVLKYQKGYTKELLYEYGENGKKTVTFVDGVRTSATERKWEKAGRGIITTVTIYDENGDVFYSSKEWKIPAIGGMGAEVNFAVAELGEVDSQYRFERDKHGNVCRIVYVPDEETVCEMEYDGEGRIVKLRNILEDRVYRYVYDGNGNLVKYGFLSVDNEFRLAYARTLKYKRILIPADVELSEYPEE